MRTWNPYLCDQLHNENRREHKRMWEAIANSNKKLWAIIIMLVANLAALAAGLAVVIAKGGGL